MLQNDNQIDAKNSIITFNNTDKNELYGLEVEYEVNIFNQDVFHFNYSLIEGDNVTDALANSSETLVNLYYLHRLSEKWDFSGRIKFVGDKSRVALDAREDVEKYYTADLTTSYQSNIKSVKFNITVKNIFDETYYLPSPGGTYPGDFEQPGRSFLLRLSKVF